MKSEVSVVIPVYGCRGCLPELVQRLNALLKRISKQYEIILVNDASPDNAWDVIVNLAKNDSSLVGINLSRNFGQHRAIAAGLDHAKSEWVVVMDCDLQDKPEEIVNLYEKAKEGYDIVLGMRKARNDNFLKKLGSVLFHKIFSYMTDQTSDHTIANFGIYRRKVIETIGKMGEQNRIFPLFIQWVGYKTAKVEVSHGKRRIGSTSYTFRKMLSLALEGVVAQSNKPLILSIKFGFILSLLSLAYALYRVIIYFYSGVEVQGWTSVIVSIYFLSGLIFANLGIIGLYIGKTFDETKRRPIYVVQDYVNYEDLE